MFVNTISIVVIGSNLIGIVLILTHLSGTISTVTARSYPIMLVWAVGRLAFLTNLLKTHIKIVHCMSFSVVSVCRKLISDLQDFLGRTEITLGEIIGSPGSKVHRKLTLVLRGENGASIYVCIIHIYFCIC